MLTMYLGKEQRNRAVALVLAAVLVASAILALLATVASAAPAPALATHARLVSVSPSDGERLDQPPARILLTFDETVPAEFAQVVLTRDGTRVAVATPTASGATLTAAITGATGPGSYRISWRATTADGHPASGESGFTVVGSSASTGAAVPVPLVTPTYKTPQTQATALVHPDHYPGLIVAGGLLLAGVALLIREHRRRHASRGGQIS